MKIFLTLLFTIGPVPALFAGGTVATPQSQNFRGLPTLLGKCIRSSPPKDDAFPSLVTLYKKAFPCSLAMYQEKPRESWANQRIEFVRALEESLTEQVHNAYGAVQQRSRMHPMLPDFSVSGFTTVTGVLTTMMDADDAERFYWKVLPKVVRDLRALDRTSALINEDSGPLGQFHQDFGFRFIYADWKLDPAESFSPTFSLGSSYVQFVFGQEAALQAILSSVAESIADAFLEANIPSVKRYAGF